MSEYIVNFDGELGMALAVACAGAGFAREKIVRCRNCAYCDKYPNDEITVCYRFDNEQPIVEPDGFCAWGERKEVGE